MGDPPGDAGQRRGAGVQRRPARRDRGGAPAGRAARLSPTVAASAERLLLAWREPGMGLRASTFSPVARPLGAPGPRLRSPTGRSATRARWR
ncbi:MAG: hypothetical protein IPN17_12955 [Deltaproteobacteria bacterium]|nr:hypothetical protein [Deltaproteobacteria bacterium]